MPRSYRGDVTPAWAIAVITCLTGSFAANGAETRGDEAAQDAQPQAVATDATTAEPAAEDDAALRAGAAEVQRALGGSVITDFPSLLGEREEVEIPADPPTAPPTTGPWWQQFHGMPGRQAAAPPQHADPGFAQPGAWTNWSLPAGGPVVVAASVQLTPPPQPPVAALRGTAAELEAAANRLEELELYRQSDALRILAQQLRVDARRLAKPAETNGDVEPPRTDGGRSMSTDPPRPSVGWQQPPADR